MDFTDEIAGDKIQLVVTAIDVNALVIEPCPDGTVKNINVVRIE